MTDISELQLFHLEYKNHGLFIRYRIRYKIIYQKSFDTLIVNIIYGYFPLNKCIPNFPKLVGGRGQQVKSEIVNKSNDTRDIPGG